MMDERTVERLDLLEEVSIEQHGHQGLRYKSIVPERYV